MDTHESHTQSSGRSGGARPAGAPAADLLTCLATLYGLQPRYRDSRGRPRESPPESVACILEVLGAGVRPGDVGDAARLSAAVDARQRALAERIVEPVSVAWDGILPDSLPGSPHRSSARLVLSAEDGTTQIRELSAESSAVSAGRRGGSERLPYGYHRVIVETDGVAAPATVISAPRRCRALSAAGQGASGARADMQGLDGLAGGLGRILAGRPWGVFAPLYALRSRRNHGVGDLADLETLAGWVAEQGGSVVSTLPLLASFLDVPFDPTPYRPVSRLFWNEIYLALEWISEWERCPAAREFWASAQTRERLRSLRDAPLVDYRAVMALKREALERLAACFFAEADSARRDAFSAFVRSEPELEDYAAFRAGLEEDAGRATARVIDPLRYHLYCQWQMEEQLNRLSAARSPGLVLDLPLGVHPQGFEIRRWPDLFVGGVSVGAPPDDFFARGQDWEFPPLDPGRSRETGHSYIAACVRRHMKHSRLLRIDHVMSLHRLYWIPEGMGAADGVYMTYPAEELYAVLSLESHLQGTAVSGEDLGTVPADVRPAMRRHGLMRTWVLQGAVRPGAAEVIGPVPPNAVTALNTHDMVPFAGFLHGEDIANRLETGQVGPEQAVRERDDRRRSVARLVETLRRRGRPVQGAGLPPSDGVIAEAFRGALAHLVRSRAALVMVNLEDVFLEKQAQNVPGTGAERPNWRRKMTIGLERLVRS